MSKWPNVKQYVIWHLATGVLGELNPPSALLQPGLVQKLTWDGKDDVDIASMGVPFSFAFAFISDFSLEDQLGAAW